MKNKVVIIVEENEQQIVFPLFVTDYEFIEETEDDSESEDEEQKHDSGGIESSNADALVTKYVDGQLRIVRTTMDFSLHNLKQVIGDNDYIDTMPSYQRRNRWDRKKKSLLIESLLLNVPVPPIFLFERDYNSYEVMDGRQRLQSITEFLEDGFSLSSLEFWKELEGKTFSKLPDVLRKGLLRRTISAIVLLAETKSTEEIDVRMVLFKRLNTGGIQLNAQELRNALYPGTYNDMLLRLSRTDEFTTAWGIPPRTQDESTNPPPELINNKLYSTMTDCELVLRFFAIRETILLNLGGSLRSLLDNCMKRHRNDSMQKISEYEHLFISCLRELNRIFDKQPFFLPKVNRHSQPLYDALMVALSFVEGKPLRNKEEIQQNLSEQLNDEKSYQILTGKGNTINAIKSRIELATKILVG